MYSKNIKAAWLPDGSGSYTAFGLGTTSVQQVQMWHSVRMLKAPIINVNYKLSTTVIIQVLIPVIRRSLQQLKFYFS
jgi:hypothetical protein